MHAIKKPAPQIVPTCIFSTTCICKLIWHHPGHDIIVKDWGVKRVGRALLFACSLYSSSEDKQIVVVFPPGVMKLWSFLYPCWHAWEMRNCASISTVSCGFGVDALYYIHMLTVCFPLFSFLLLEGRAIYEIQGHMLTSCGSLNRAAVDQRYGCAEAVWWGFGGNTPWQCYAQHPEWVWTVTFCNPYCIQSSGGLTARCVGEGRFLSLCVLRQLGVGGGGGSGG